MPLDTGVTVEDVRAILNEIDANQLPDSAIQAAIDDEETVVDAMLPPDWENAYDDLTTAQTEDLVAVYVKRRAAREGFNNSPMIARKQALDAVVSYDVQSFRGRLNDRVDEIEEILFPGHGGEHAAFVDATEHAGDQDIHERLEDLTDYPGAFRW